MKTKGSITIFLCFMISIIVSLVVASIDSVKLAASRTLIINAMDQSLYSTFAEYDKDLLEKYKVFFLDGGYGSSSLQTNIVYQRLKENLSENITGYPWIKMQVKNGGISGYTLATDGNGQVFRQQVLSYMEDTFGLQSASLLLEILKKNKSDITSFENRKNEMDYDNSIQDYDKAKEEASNSQNPVETTPEVTGKPVENPIEIIKEIKKMGILSLVIKDSENLSKKEIELGNMASNRELQKGIGIIELSGERDAALDTVLFDQYLIKNMQNYTNAGKNQEKLDYQVEYILEGKKSDIENLKGVVNQILLVREAANAISILADVEKRSQVTALATTIASSLGFPALFLVVEIGLIASWAYAESLLDARILLNGGKVPMAKSRTSWNLSLENLSRIKEILEGVNQKQGEGLSYEDYIRTLLFLKDSDSITKRAIDIVEIGINNRSGRENFRMDSCILSLEASFDIQSGKTDLSIQKSYTYEM